MATATDTIEEFARQDYKYGFVSDIETETIPIGLNEETVRLISSKKSEPEWLLVPSPRLTKTCFSLVKGEAPAQAKPSPPM